VVNTIAKRRNSVGSIMSCLTNWNKIQCQLAERVLSVCKISRNLDKNHPEFKHKWYRSCSGAKTLPWHVTGATTFSMKTISIKWLFETLSIRTLRITTFCRYAECRVLFIVMLSVTMLIIAFDLLVCCVALCWVSWYNAKTVPRWVQSVKLSIVVNLVSDVEHCWLSCTWYKQY